jgi:phospholipase C
MQTRLRGYCSLIFGLFFLLALAGCRGLFSAADLAERTKMEALHQNVNHIIFMVQENRSFDHYFGQIGAYREKNGYGLATDVDGIPADATNPDLAGTSMLKPYHLETTCVEELSPGWVESHADVNYQDPGSSTALMNGFVSIAAKYAMFNGEFDTNGVRAMGYYDDSDLPFYYFMASNFAMSDRWFSPVMTESIPNRIFLQAATTGGHVHPPIADAGQCCDQLPTIYHRLSEAGVSWKVYYSDTQANGAPLTDINNYWPNFAAAHSANIVPISDFFKDLTFHTLPSVAFVQAGLGSGRDEHPGGQSSKGEGGNDIQLGAKYVWEIITQFMQSSSWKDSVFILTFDEGGSFYDHVPPAKATRPDDTNPIDLLPTDSVIQPQGRFDHTGFRLPVIVISPFSKKSYVSHTPTDSTAILKLIESRFNLDHLTKRDRDQMDMTEFFDFANVPWRTPPSPPDQPVEGKCNPTNLPSPASITQ